MKREIRVMQGAPERDYGFRPGTELRAGLKKFAEWYREYYKTPLPLAGRGDR